MPELPEVETIKRQLKTRIIGLKLSKITILNQKSFQGDATLLEGTVVVEVWRRAKMLGVDVVVSRQSSDLSLQISKQNSSQILTILFHLKMSGQVIFVGKQGAKKGGFSLGHPTTDMFDEMPNKSTRVIFEFSNGSKVYFNDQRKFGWVKVIKRAEIEGLKTFQELGPEPLEGSFSWKILKECLLKHKNIVIKVALLDQKTIAGVGNIYASEALFIAKIDPRRIVSTLSDNDFQKLHAGIIESLQKSIEEGGSSRTHYVNVEGKRGSYLDFAFVYNRKDGICRICRSRIKKITLGGRGTFYCELCQK